MMEQVLDSMDIERERGITIKAQAVRVMYDADDGQTYQLNLIDTPGHVDFTYEVSRSLEACEGVILVVDATQGVEAQTVANALMAMNAHLEIIPLINKIDLPAADPERVRHEIEEGLAVPADEAVLASGKTGEGVREVLEAVVRHVPPPTGDAPMPAQGTHLRQLLRCVPRRRRARSASSTAPCMKGLKVRMMATDVVTDVEEVGVRRPANVPVDELDVGEVGYLITGLKDPSLVKVGDTVTLARHGATEQLPGYREVKPMVFTGLFPIDGDQYPELRDALDKLTLNDPALIYEPESSHALGFGFRVGFLGLLHMEVIKERLEREFDLELLATAPSVEYHAYLTNGTEVVIHSPQDMPDPSKLDYVEEPFLKTTVIVPPDYVGAVMELSISRRATFIDMQYLSKTTVELHYEMPLSELIMDFFDQLKSRTKGYASLDYESIGYRPRQHGEARHPARRQAGRRAVVHRAQGQGVRPRQGAHREAEDHHSSADVRGADPGGDRRPRSSPARRCAPCARTSSPSATAVTSRRKRKLLEKQKKGKKRMKNIGSVEVPQEAFMAILKVDE